VPVWPALGFPGRPSRLCEHAGIGPARVGLRRGGQVPDHTGPVSVSGIWASSFGPALAITVGAEMNDFSGAHLRLGGRRGSPSWWWDAAPYDRSRRDVGPLQRKGCEYSAGVPSRQRRCHATNCRRQFVGNGCPTLATACTWLTLSDNKAQRITLLAARQAPSADRPDRRPARIDDAAAALSAAQSSLPLPSSDRFGPSAASRRLRMTGARSRRRGERSRRIEYSDRLPRVTAHTPAAFE
jgi:hypothetical protein